MTGARMNLKVDDTAFQDALRRLGGTLRAGVMKGIAAGLVEETQRRFDNGVSPTGARWAALHPAYAAIKRGPGLLRESRMLQRSITSSVDGSRVTIGSNRVYAAVHQFGATIRPRNGKTLAFRLGVSGPRGGKGSGLVFARSVTIPARPYLGFGAADQEAVMDVLEQEISTAFRG